MVNVTSLFTVAQSALGFSFGLRALTEIKIWCVKRIFMLNEVSSDASHAHSTIACHRFVSK